MADYREITNTVEVPQNVGIKGFLKAIEDILKLPRVQNINIDSKGVVEYRYCVREGEPAKPLEVSFDTLMPYAVIRNGKVVELGDPDANCAIAAAQLFNLAAADHLFPVAFVGGANTRLWPWYVQSTAVDPVSREELFGVPFLVDRHLEDHVLVLCAAYTRTGALIDTQKSYKLVIPQVQA